MRAHRIYKRCCMGALVRVKAAVGGGYCFMVGKRLYGLQWIEK